MARPRLDPAMVATRLAAARKKAQKINSTTPRHVYASATPSGRVSIRYEPPGGRKVVLRSPYPSIEFDGELLARRCGKIPAAQVVASKTKAKAAIPATDVGTWSWLCEQYYRSIKYQSYTQRDQRVRRGVLGRSCTAPLMPDEPQGLTFGDMPLNKFQTIAIRTLRDRFSVLRTTPDEMYPNDRTKDRMRPTTPEAGNSTVKYIRGVLDWAIEEHTDMVGGRNWGKDVKYNRRGDGYATWTEDQCKTFEAAHPLGTRMRLIYDIARFTGQRLSDIARLGECMIEQHACGGRTLQIKQAKGRSRKSVIAYIPLFPELESALEAARNAGVLGKETYIEKSTGGPYTTESLGNLFNGACQSVGLNGYSIHGLRKTAVVELLRAGCTITEVMAITGHRSIKEIENYAREYRRCEAAKSTLRKFATRADRN